MLAGRPDACRANSTSSERRLTRVVSPRPVYGDALASFRNAGPNSDHAPRAVDRRQWKGAPVFSDQGIVCVANAFKGKVKLTFYEGASLPDPNKLFNSGLEGTKWRTIDLYEGDEVNERSLKVLIRAGVDFNRDKAKPPAKKKAAKVTA